MPTISDVARQAGVATGTVSRYLNAAPNISPEIALRIQKAIAELGYVPNNAARSLRSRRSNALALVVPDITNAFWSAVARGVEDAVLGRGYALLLCNTDDDLARQSRHLSVLASQQVEGVVVAPTESKAHQLAILRDRGIPTVVVDRRLPDWDGDAIYSDSIAGARALTRHLLKLGHRRIAVVTGRHGTSTAEDRVVGYCMALHEQGLEPDPRLVRFGRFGSGHGEEAAHQLLEEHLAPTAFLAANNAIAKGVLQALAARQLRVPQDVALVCFGDSPDTTSDFSQLTVVLQPAYEIGTNAAQLLLSRLGSDVPLQPRNVVLPMRMVIRRSCGSQLDGDGDAAISVPVPLVREEPGVLVRPLTPDEVDRIGCAGVGDPGLSAVAVQQASSGISNGRRLHAAMHCQEVDRIPLIEVEPPTRRFCDYVLERDTRGDATGSLPSPEDHLACARRLGLDAVLCDLGAAPTFESPLSGEAQEQKMGPTLAEQLTHLDRYLNAGRDAGVTIIASIPLLGPESWTMAETGVLTPLLFRRLEAAVAEQERLVWTICNRFASELSLVMLHDRIPASHRPGQIGQALGLNRIARLAAPAKQHGKAVIWRGTTEDLSVTSGLNEAGVAAVLFDGAEHPPQASAAQGSEPLAWIDCLDWLKSDDPSSAEIESSVRSFMLQRGLRLGYLIGLRLGDESTSQPAASVLLARALGRLTQPV